jgi:hypothetical protein
MGAFLAGINWWVYAITLLFLLVVSIVLVAYKDIVKKVFRDCHTGVDNTSYDWAKVYGSLSLLVYLVLCAWHLRDDDIFEPVAFASGLSAIIVAVCAGVAVKRFATPAAVAGTTTEASTKTTVVDPVVPAKGV